MTLEGLIDYEEKASKATWNGKTTLCAEEHEQLAEWLKDYKRLLGQEPCEDCISRQNVIGVLNANRDSVFYETVNYNGIMYDICKLPSVKPAEKQEPCDDCIRREDALMALTGEYTDSPIEILPKAIKRINALPPVTPAEKVGRWIVHPKGIYAHLICDKCLSNAPYDCRTNYCPNCGAKMDVPDNNVGEMGGEQE